MIQHLQHCFYLTTPYQEGGEDKMQGGEEEEEILISRVDIYGGEDMEVTQDSQSCGVEGVLNSKAKVRFDNILKMMTNKRAPQINSLSCLKKKKKRHQTQVNHPNFIGQFQQFFQGFLQQNQLLSSIKRARRKKTTKKMTMYMTKTDQSEVIEQKNEEEDEEQIFIRKMEKRMTYHRRMKQKMSDKVVGLVGQVEEKRLRRIEMLDKERGVSVEKVLKMKETCSKMGPKMRMSRSGLPVRLHEMDPKTKTGNSLMAQNLKAKKDSQFYKSLQKNCEVVLSELTNFQQQEINNKNQMFPIEDKPHNLKSHFMRNTFSGNAKNQSKSSKVRKSMDDGDFSRWQQTCLQIQKNCHHNRAKSKQLSGGLKIFQGFCKHVDSKLKLKKKKLNQIIFSSPFDSQNNFPYYIPYSAPDK